MDCALPTSASDDADFSWSDNQSVDSAASEDNFYRPVAHNGHNAASLSTSLPNSCSSVPSLSSLSSPISSSPPNASMAMAAWMSQQHQQHQHQQHHDQNHHYNSHRHLIQSQNQHHLDLHHHQHQYDHGFAHQTSHHAQDHHGHSRYMHGHRHSISDTRNIHTGQLSPVSTGMMEMTLEGLPTTLPVMIESTSASSSCTTDSSWDKDDCDNADDEVDDEDREEDMLWEQGDDNILTIPKLEPTDDEYLLDQVQVVPTQIGIDAVGATRTALPDHAAGAASDAPVKLKRPRGRPRKHPLNTVVNASKIAKGRSKTGCITCRRRKKKCDEAKPRCMNCEKNAVCCEGYHEKQIWKSGRERAEEERLRRESFPSVTMQPIFHGVETAEDKVFWRHYFHHLSNVLTVEGEARNAFKDMILQLATKHKGLMHSILSVSSRHIDLDTPYGSKLLQDHPNTTLDALHNRSDHHRDEAMKHLYHDMTRPVDRDDPEYDTILSARYGQMICLILQTRAEGNPRGEHRVHLQAYQKLIQHSPPEDPAFLNFISEFFDYHIYADELIWHPDMSVGRLADNQPLPVVHDDPWALPPPAMHSGIDTMTPRPSTPGSSSDEAGAIRSPYPPRLLGVFDGLFQYLTQITTMRNTIRHNIATGVDPVVDYTCLYRAAEIDAAIREWKPHFPPGDSRDRVGLLYKQMMWVYLFRTTYPPSQPSVPQSAMSSMPASAGPSSRRHSMTAKSRPSGASALQAKIQTQMQTPYTRPTSPTAMSTPAHKVRMQPHTPTTPISPAITIPTRPTTSSSSIGFSTPSAANIAANLGQDADPISRPSSPPPIRRPPHHDRRITVAVDEALDLLESFKPSDPSQTLLLIPCLVVGTAAFDPAQRERVRSAVRAVKGYTGLRNCDRVLELLTEVWRLMEEGNWIAVWDWQALARRMRLDFLCA